MEAGLEDDIRKAEVRGQLNLSLPDKNLLKAKIDSVLEELKATKNKKNELIDLILR